MDGKALCAREDYPKDTALVLGSLPKELLSELSLAVLSPGISIEEAFVSTLKEAEIPVWGEIELAWNYEKGKVLAITGTNGKTTTTTLVGEIMKRYQDNTFVVGNIGTPYTQEVLKTDKDSVTVAEISSFQLETAVHFHPTVSAILNITPDHLNRHHTMECYIKTKERIAENQTEDEVCVLNYEDEVLRAFGETLHTNVLYFYSRQKLDRGLYLDGEDIYGKPMLAALLRELCRVEGLHWIRTLYTYPDRITDELLDTVASEEKLVKYFDIPLQHVNGDILKRMNRKGNYESLSALIDKIRARIPNVTLRTTLITGFPGETEEQFCELVRFVKEKRFDRLGCFTYSAEEDTAAALFPDQIDEQTKQDRMDNIMELQQTISAEKNEEKIGTVTEVLTEGWDDYIKCYFGRTQSDAPEVDGKIFFMSSRPLVIGEFVKVRINDTLDYDLLGELEE